MDITWLKTHVKGRFLYAYIITDMFSRMIVGWFVEDAESSEYARDLFERVISKRGLGSQFVHSDNGNPMRGLTLVAFLNMLDVKI